MTSQTSKPRIGSASPARVGPQKRGCDRICPGRSPPLQTIIFRSPDDVPEIILLAWAAWPDRHAFVVQHAAMYAVGTETELRWPLGESLHHVAARILIRVPLWPLRIRSTHGSPGRGGGDRTPSSMQFARGRPTSCPRFRLARTILLDKRDTAISMLPGALLRGNVTRGDLRT
jgi:hypothetical protein